MTGRLEGKGEEGNEGRKEERKLSEGTRGKEREGRGRRGGKRRDGVFFS